MRAAVRRKWCAWLTWIVVTAMAAVCMMFFADPYRPWMGVGPEEMWAVGRKWQFYFFVIATGAAALGSVMLWLIGKRGHRAAVVGLWVVFATVLIVYHAERLSVMIRMMWRYH